MEFGFLKICLLNDEKCPALWVVLHCEWASEDKDKEPLSISELLLNDGMCSHSHTHEIHPFWEGFVKGPAFNKQGSTAMFESFLCSKVPLQLKSLLEIKEKSFPASCGGFSANLDYS